MDRSLEDLRVTARQNFPPNQELLYQVLKKDGSYRLQQGEEEFLCSPDVDRIVLYLHELINFHIRSNMTADAALHAACATLGGKRFLLVGDKAAGKTTLLCKLLFHGVEVHGDEHVFVQDTQVIAFPRRFHIKPGTLNLIPEMAEVCRNLKPYRSFSREWLYLFDPTLAGFDWKIAGAPVAAVFYLQPNHSGDTRLAILPKWQMVQKLMGQIDNFSAEPGSQIKNLCGLVNHSDCFNLNIGNLIQAVTLITEILKQVSVVAVAVALPAD